MKKTSFSALSREGKYSFLVLPNFFETIGCNLVEYTALDMFRGLFTSSRNACLQLVRGLASKQQTAKRERIDFPSIIKFKELYGHLLIPQWFKFEKSEDGRRGSYLGVHAMHLRNMVKKKPELLKEDDFVKLQSMGFEFAINEDHFMRFVTAMNAYRKIYGHCYVPLKYKVPCDDTFPQEVWNMKLGWMYVNYVLRKEPTPERKAILHANNIPTTSLKQRRAELILRAIQNWRKLHNIPSDQIIKVAQSFIVPRNEEWPEETWDLRLGLIVRGIRKGNYKEFPELIQQMGAL